MNWKEILTIIISCFGVIISAIALYRSSKASSSALNIQYASVELAIRNAIENSKNQIQTLSLTYAPLKVKYDNNTLSDEDNLVFEIYKKSLNSMIESMLNQYDDACAKYIDNKVDKVRFKRTYHKEISNLVENKDFKEYFDPVTSNYKPILLVYREWFDLENNK
ncbi:hypothetical protein Xsto_03941 [Xenorhabdus stockiae]|uniref:Uncharacterized protein n=1 Tax=Xenorhabdus stockiae TaxID=351614 RepID=A0A2D0KAW7_9GAMM|nr:hypothetical protein [Xenorhabdus stockiae]PHM60510.1 hypothetical protein Xsto_03941 [Xenorhabdus stockiae]